MSPRTLEQNQALRDESRTRIIDAALALFAANGYEATSVRQIAKTAGVAQGLMYSHFSGKDALLQAIFQRSLTDVYESFALADTNIGPDGPIVDIIRAAFRILRERRDFWRLSYSVRMQQTVLAALGDELFAWTDTIRRTIEAAFSRAGQPDATIQAAILFATIDGVAQHYVIDPDHYPLDAVIEALVVSYRR